MKILKSAAPTGLQCERILQKIAYAVWPSAARERVAMNTKGNLCHALVAKAIGQRENPKDKVWLYGVRPDVYHSVLSDQHDTPLVGNTYGISIRPGFRGARGFDTGIGTLLLLKCVSVYDIMVEYTTIKK